ncbi:MAG: DNA methyltransferase, partial [Acidimicrobiales bacterium]
PQRLIDLYTYRGDLVLDPFMGSGTTAVAALRAARHFAGYETDPQYRAASLERIAAERARLGGEAEHRGDPGRPLLPAVAEAVDPAEGFLARAVREGRRARELARWALDASGFTVVGESKRLEAGVEVNFVAEDGAGGEWLFDVSGAFTSTRGGLQRMETLWKALGKATVVHHTRPAARFVLLTTDKPAPNSAGGQALREVTGTGAKPVYDVIGLRCSEDLDRLAGYARPRRRAHARPPTRTRR